MLTKGACGVTWGGTHPKKNIYKPLNETSSMRSHTRPICRYVADNSLPVYLKTKLWTYHYILSDSVHGEAMLKIGWIVKNSIYSLLSALNLARLHSDSKLIYLFAIHIN